jgi:uncharacterized protein (TIGR00730 family)
MPQGPLSVCVFCGSRAGAMPEYEREATAFGAALAAEGWRLVYGAGDVGLMGAVAGAAIAAGGRTLGVIPQHLMRAERGRGDLTHLIVTETMHERKKVMFMNADAIVVLPGGAGSLDEFFEVLTWAQIGLHRKPILLVDSAGFWRPLVALLDHVVAQGFAEASLLARVTVVADTAAAIAALRDQAGPAAISPAP